MKRAIGLLLLAGLLLGARSASADPAVGVPEPELADERVILHTLAGDIVLGLFPKIAPKTVAQFLKLVRLGVYDGTHFYRVEPGFVIQLSNAQDRQFPMTPAQTAAITQLSAEFSTQVKHQIFTLSMARMPDNPNSAETSFSILLGDAPHLDGQYTIFGRVEQGVEALFEMLKVSRDSSHRPAVRLTVERAEVVDTLRKLASTKLRDAVPIKDPSTSDESRLGRMRRMMALGLLLLASLAVAGFLLRRRLSPRHVGSLFLLQVLVAAFLLLPLLVPMGHVYGWLPPITFLGLLGLFRLMSRFESA